MRSLILVLCLGVAGLASAEKGMRRHSLTLGANFSHVLTFGYDFRIFPALSIGLGVGYFGISYNSPDYGRMNFSTESYEGHIRIHPFKGAFYLGVLGGTQKLSGDTTRDLGAGLTSELPLGVSVKGVVNVQSTYVTPHIGWAWQWNSGITLGFDLGYQFNFSPKTTVSVPVSNPLLSDLIQGTSEYQDLVNDVTDVGNKIGSTSVPFITLLRFGYCF